MEKLMKNEKNEASQTLERGIKGWQVGFIALGGVIGSCYFLGVGYTINKMGPAVLLAYALVGVIVYGLMVSYAELLVNLPRSGSFVAYTNEFLGETISVGIGWSFWFNWVCYVPSEAVAVGTLANAIISNYIPNANFQFVISVIALLIISIIQLAGVQSFAKIESTLAIIKIGAIIAFIIAAAGIFLGIWGNTHGFVGTSVVLGDPTKSISEQLFPAGASVILIMMVTVLVTFQGTEIVGLTAAEAQDPEVSVPMACKSVTYRIVGLYILPILLLVLLIPFSQAGVEDSIFSITLQKYGLGWLAAGVSVVIIIAAFSCANSGFYATTRCLYSLSVEGLAPKGLSNLNKHASPQNAVVFTIIPMWIVLIIGSFFSGGNLYTNLLTMSGFTGTLCWVGIIGSQLIFRKRLKARNYDAKSILKARVKYTIVPAFALVAQFTGLMFLIFDKEKISVFIMAVAAIVLPMTIRIIAKKTGHTRELNTLKNGELSFDEKYPPIEDVK